MAVPRSEDRALFVRAVRRAFADALLAEMGRTSLKREEAAKSGGITRSYLQYLLAAKRQTTISTLISLAAGLGVRPETLMAKTMQNLSRIQRDSTPTIHAAPSAEEK